MFRPAAVSLIQTDDVESGTPCLGGDGAHIVGLAASFETMNQDQCGVAQPLGMPMAEAQDPTAGLDGEETRLARDAAEQMPPRPVSRNQRHQVGVCEQR